MPHGIAIAWTHAEDTTIRRMRSECAEWQTIARVIKRPIRTCMDRARTIGAQRGVPLIETVVRGPDVSDDRLPLPAGHPQTWTLLTVGTVLEGAAYVNA
jgi:hypothetical protein